MATANGVKEEDDDEPILKSEMDATPSLGFVDDVVEDEDTGELTMHPAPPHIWLTRIPRYLWDAISTMKDDEEEVQIGVVKHWEVGTGDQKKPKMQLCLDPKLPRNEEVPKDYWLNFINQQTKNTYVFSERDQPGYKPNSFNRARMNRGGHSGGGVGKYGGRRGDKRQSMARKSIPKSTTLLGVVRHELTCTPIENEEFKRLQAERTAKTLKPKTKFETSALERSHEIGHATGFEHFIKPNAPLKPVQKPVENKAARIPQNELLDQLFALFKEYRYWRLNTLKQRTFQPETYLKETLLKIAYLVKTGPHANTWTLTQDAQASTYLEGMELKDEEAPEEPGGGGGGSGDDDDDDDEVEMEDAL